MPHNEQPSKPALAVGQFWRRRDGEIVEIELFDEKDADYPFYAKGCWYTVDGHVFQGGRPDNSDLVKLIYAEPAPAQRKIVQLVCYPKGTEIYAVADDGTAWVSLGNNSEWQQIPPLPSSEVANA